MTIDLQLITVIAIADWQDNKQIPKDIRSPSNSQNLGSISFQKDGDESIKDESDDDAQGENIKLPKITEEESKQLNMTTMQSMATWCIRE